MAPIEKIDLQKSKRRNNIIIVLCIIVITYASFFFKEKEVIILHKTWEADNNFCHVSFEVKNNTPHKIWTNITIKAYRKKRLQRSNFSNQIVGEKSMAIVLLSDEKKKFTESIKITARPESLTVKIWKP
jgi:hypothetical protein